MTKIEIPCAHAKELSDIFSSINEPVRYVGGCVRNALAGKHPKDIDLASPALPEAVLEAAEALGYKTIPTGLKHGTVTVVIDSEPYEITTLRTDVETDGRHASVEFVTDYKTDAARRDFTINAMSVDLDGRLYDYFGGVEDLKNRRVRFVGDMNERIEEDYLRILRFYRFRTNFGGNEDLGYDIAIGKHANGLKQISGERIWSEMSRILSADDCLKTLNVMKHTGVLDAIGFDTIPSISSVRADHIPNKSTSASAVILGLFARNLEVVKDISETWRLSSIDRDCAKRAVFMRDLINSGRQIYKKAYFWTCLAVDGFPRADIESVLIAMDLSHVVSDLPDTLPVFPVQGRDLIGMGMKPGKEIGQLLSKMKESWMSSHFNMSKEDLLAMEFDLNEKSDSIKTLGPRL